MAEAAVATDVEQGAMANDLGIPLFLFCYFRTTGSNLLTDEVSEVAVKCWPYREDVPSFHYQVLTRTTTYIASNCKRHGRFQHAVTELCRWIEETVKEASAKLRAQLYPVLFSHGGDSKDFLFLFRSCAKNGIDLSQLSKLPIHFADPVPLLELLKVRRHPLLTECKYLTLGSLLNDWYPGMFNPADLKNLPSRAALTSQLYTQTTLYPVLSKVPIYNIAEWNQYYEAALKYKEDKRELEAHMPKHLKEVQAKFAVRAILRAGYSWTTLLDLFKACSCPLQFRQELRDIDVQSSIARDISWMITDMKLEQTGSRPYILRIKKNMSPQEYIGFRSPRGYYFVLRVANKFPQCFLTLADLEFSLQEHPIDVPTGFSLMQRLVGPEAAIGPNSPRSRDFNNNELFNLTLFPDEEVADEWLEEEEGESGDRAEDFLESYSQFQMERAESQNHEITSFVMNVDFNRSLLLNCMEEEGELDSGPGLTEDEQKKRAALWDSVRENIPEHLLNKNSALLEKGGDSDKSDKRSPNKKNQGRATKEPPGRHKGSRKGSRGGRRQGRSELQKWNRRARSAVEEKENWNATYNRGSSELPKQAAVCLPGTAVNPMEGVGVGYHDNRVGSCSTGGNGDKAGDDRVGFDCHCNKVDGNLHQTVTVAGKGGICHSDGGDSCASNGSSDVGGASGGCYGDGGCYGNGEGDDSGKIRRPSSHVEDSCQKLDACRAPCVDCHGDMVDEHPNKESVGVSEECCGCHGDTKSQIDQNEALQEENGRGCIILVEHPSGLGVDIIYPLGHGDIATKLSEDGKGSTSGLG